MELADFEIVNLQDYGLPFGFGARIENKLLALRGHPNLGNTETQARLAVNIFINGSYAYSLVDSDTWLR